MKELIRKFTYAGVILIGAIASSTNVSADHDELRSFNAYGEVVEAEPIIVKVTETTPHKECRQVRRQRVVRRHRVVHRDHHDDKIQMTKPDDGESQLGYHDQLFATRHRPALSFGF